MAGKMFQKTSGEAEERNRSLVDEKVLECLNSQSG